MPNPLFKKPVEDLIFLYIDKGIFYTKKTSQTLCTSLIQCYFDYCCPSWFYSLPTKWKHKLQVMQNNIIRFMLKLKPRSHIGREEFEKLGMWKVEDRIKKLKLNQVFKIVHDEAHEYLISHFRKFQIFTNTYSTWGSATNFIPPKGSSVQFIFLYWN